MPSVFRACKLVIHLLLLLILDFHHMCKVSIVLANKFIYLFIYYFVSVWYRSRQPVQFFLPLRLFLSSHRNDVWKPFVITEKHKNQIKLLIIMLIKYFRYLANFKEIFWVTKKLSLESDFINFFFFFLLKRKGLCYFIKTHL